MSKPATFNIKTTQPGFIIRTQGGTLYNVLILMYNSSNESKVISQYIFNEIVFESLYQSPFALGRIQLKDDNQQLKFDVDEIANNIQYNFQGTGEEFLYIKLDLILDNNNTSKRRNLVDKTFIVQSRENLIINSNSVLDVYFADLLYGELKHKKINWSTNNVIGRNPTHLSTDQKQVYVGTAIENLLTTYIGKNAISKTWDKGTTKTERNLLYNESACDALFDLMSNYVSSNNDMGILRLLNDKFQLSSILDIYKNVISFKNLKNIYRISTHDNRRVYSNDAANSMFAGVRRYIEIDISSTSINMKPANSNQTNIVDHSVISYNAGRKKYNIINNEGSVSSLTSLYDSYNASFPDYKKKQLDIQKGKLYTNSKHIAIDYTPSTNYYKGRTMLQAKSIDNSDKITIIAPGNYQVHAGTFIGIRLDIPQKNKFVKDSNGFWFVTRNLSILKEGEFSSYITAAKTFKTTV